MVRNSLPPSPSTIHISFICGFKFKNIVCIRNVLFMTALERLFQTMGKVDFAHILGSLINFLGRGNKRNLSQL